MLELESGAVARPLHPVGPDAPTIAERHDMSVRAKEEHSRPKFRIERLIDLNLLLMILLVGVPVLLSCILPPGN